MFNENRKKQTSNGAFPLNMALLLIIGSTLALGYVWLEMKGEALGERIKQLERDRVEIKRRYDHEVWKWENMKSPSNIEGALKRNNIVMVWPDEINIVHPRQRDVSTASIQGLAGQVAQFAQTGRP